MAPSATTAAPTDAYADLTARLTELSALSSVESLLGWDEMVMLPPGDAAAELRGAQKAAMAGVVHGKATAPELGAALAALQVRGTRRERARWDGGCVCVWMM
jgi:Zn-dependent M32 family carboxypeptidase